jgi:hypothetical protein
MRAFATLALVLLAACPGTKSIKELLDDPSRFDGETIRIAGEVKTSIGALGVGAYQVDDGTGTITVISKAGNGAPWVGTMIGVEGEFRSAFTVGTVSAAVVIEQRRRAP